MNLLTEHAKELLGMPPEWDAYEFEAIGHTTDNREATGQAPNVELSGPRPLAAEGSRSNDVLGRGGDK